MASVRNRSSQRTRPASNFSHTSNLDKLIPTHVPRYDTCRHLLVSLGCVFASLYCGVQAYFLAFSRDSQGLAINEDGAASAWDLLHGSPAVLYMCIGLSVLLMLCGVVGLYKYHRVPNFSHLSATERRLLGVDDDSDIDDDGGPCTPRQRRQMLLPRRSRAWHEVHKPAKPFSIESQPKPTPRLYDDATSDIRPQLMWKSNISPQRAAALGNRTVSENELMKYLSQHRTSSSQSMFLQSDDDALLNMSQDASYELSPQKTQGHVSTVAQPSNYYSPSGFAGSSPASRGRAPSYRAQYGYASSRSQKNAQQSYPFSNMNTSKYMPSFHDSPMQKTHSADTIPIDDPKYMQHRDSEADQLLEKLGIERDVDDWVDFIRGWISNNILSRKVAELRHLDKWFTLAAKHLLQNAAAFPREKVLLLQSKQVTEKLADFIISEGKKNAQPHQNIRRREKLNEYMGSGGVSKRQYVRHRMEELCATDTMRDFKWNAGGLRNMASWDPHFGTDSEIILRAFLKFMDEHLEGFSKTHFATADQSAKKKHKFKTITIVQVSINPPYFCLGHPKGVWFVRSGYDNLFHTLVLFFYYVKTEMRSRIGPIDISDSALNLQRMFD